MNSYVRGLLLTAATGSALVLGGMATTASAQVAPMPYVEVDMLFDSGEVANNAPVARGEETVAEVIWSQVVVIPDASWSRLFFGQVMLGGTLFEGDASYVRITSLIDGETQFLDARSMQQWSLSSARFAGGQLLVELLAYPGTGANRLQINAAWAGDLEPISTPESICGPNDDRFFSPDARVGRISPIGCSAWLINTPSGSCMLTAGHCPLDVTWSANEIIEFQVPFSNVATGATNPASPNDQYPVDNASIQAQRLGGVNGADWAYLGCFANSNTGLRPRDAQGVSFLLPPTQPAVNNGVLRITGYGTDSNTPVWNQVCQTDTGTYDTSNGVKVTYDDVDTTPGNSGSPVFLDASNIPVAIHTNGGCTTPALGNQNRGTRIDNAALRAALAAPLGVCSSATGVCPGEGNCFAANSTPGCGLSDCCTIVCNADPFCCETEWDSTCVAAALQNCGDCGTTNAGPCATANGTPGCDDADCCAAVCAADPFCCETEWDSQCAAASVSLCADCFGHVIQNNLGTGLGDFGIFGEGGFAGFVSTGFTVPSLYELTCVTLRLNYTPGAGGQIGAGDAQVSIWTGATSPDTLVQDLDAPALQQGQDDFVFVAPAPVTFVPGENYWLRVRGGSNGSFLWYFADGQPTGVGTHIGILGAADDLRHLINALPVQLPNDECANAIPVTNGSTTAFNTAGATTDGGADACGPLDNDLYYSYTAPASGLLTVSACGSSGDLSIAIYEGCSCPVGAFSSIVCADDDCGLAPEAEVQVTAGQCYLIRIGGSVTGATGAGELTVNLAGAPSNDTCETAIEVIAGSPVPFDTVGAASNGGAEFCANMEADIYYTYTPPVDGVMTVGACNSTPGMAIAVYDDCDCPPAAFTSVACANDGCAGNAPELQLQVTAGQCYLIRIGADITGTGSGDLLVTLDGAPANDDCSGAVEAFEGLTAFDNTFATDSGATASCGPIEADLYYTYIATDTGDLTVQTCSASFASVFAVYNGCGCPVGPEVACPINGFCSETFPVVAGQCYLIRLGSDPGLGGGVGSGNLDISLAVPTPCGDPAAGACDDANGTPGCDDGSCCEMVCALDPFCCDNEWDQQCANLAIAECGLSNCPCDVFVDGTVNVQDLLFLLAQWGTPNADCNMDGTTNVLDMLDLLAAWGPCPI